MSSASVWYQQACGKRDDFDFEIISFSYLVSNVPATPAYGVNLLRLIRYERACASCSDFQARHKLLAENLIKQGFTANRLINTFKEFYGKHRSQEQYK